MRAMIGIGWYQKPDMMEWALRGIAENFDPCDVMFCFEASTGEDRDALFEHQGILDNFKIRYPYSTSDHILEHGVHRLLIDQFMQTDCDVLIIPHDDNRFQRPLLPDLEEIWKRDGTGIGWISGRDGYNKGYTDMISSPFSSSDIARKKAPIGTFSPRLLMNTGPVVYFRHVIEKVGMPDEDMPWFWWDDLSLRCNAAGLQNYHLSMDCLHEKFGRLSHNPDLYNDDLVARCKQKLHDLWGPIV